MAEPQNYMQQVNAQQMARRKQRQQRFSSNVVNPVESQGMMDRLQGSDVGSFSGGGDDSGIVPLNMLAGGGTPATTASYGGGTPATEAAFGDGFANIFGGGGNSRGNCATGQCGPRQGNAVAQLPVSTGPFPAYDDTEARIIYGHNMINNASRSPDPSTRGIGTQAGIFQKSSAQDDYARDQARAAHKTNLAREPETYALAKKNAETAVAAAELEKQIKFHATPEGQAKYNQGLEDALVSNDLPLDQYAQLFAANQRENQPRDGSGLPLGTGISQADALAEGYRRGRIYTTISFAHGQNHTDKSKMSPKELVKFTADQEKRLTTLSTIPVAKEGERQLSHEEHVIGNVYPQLRETFRFMESQGINPEDTAAIAAAHAIADQDALEIRDVMLSHPPTPERTWSEAARQNLPAWPAIDFSSPSQVPSKTKKPLAPNSPQIWGW